MTHPAIAANQASQTSAIKSRIEKIVGPQNFKLWFKNSTQFTCADGFMKVGTPNLYLCGWIENHYGDVIAEAAREVVGKDLRITYSIDPVLFRNMRKSQLDSQAAAIEKYAARAQRDGRTAAAAQPRKLRGRLDDFVVGPSNRLAHSAAVSVVENPEGDASPVFIHSGCGLGKTHLLQGIANALADRRPAVRWVYASGEEFTNQFLFALRSQKLDAFRHRFREIDVLLLDDMQFIANKRATQEEFFHTFNSINGMGKRVVLASDAHPKMIGDLSESLVNRLVAGMVVRIERPQFQTRCEFLRRRASALNHVVPEAVIAYIAERIESNIRELEGSLVRLLAFSAALNAPVTLDSARKILDEHVTQTGKIVSVSDIELSVCTFFGLTPPDLHTSRKSRTIALARNVAMFLARKHTRLSFPEIARMMGNKNHTTVLLACRRIQQLLDQDAEVNWQSAAGVQARKLAEIIHCQEENLRR